jgi:hypothetical protein
MNACADALWRPERMTPAVVEPGFRLPRLCVAAFCRASGGDRRLCAERR